MRVDSFSFITLENPSYSTLNDVCYLARPRAAAENAKKAGKKAKKPFFDARSKVRVKIGILECLIQMRVKTARDCAGKNCRFWEILDQAFW